jgi:hypothetical protein
MGIPKFTLWFQANNKQAYVPMQKVQVDHLYIDMNSVLHNVLRRGEPAAAGCTACNPPPTTVLHRPTHTAHHCQLLCN